MDTEDNIPATITGKSADLRGSRPYANVRDMSTMSTFPIEPKELRPLLHADVDRLPDVQLALAHRLLLEIELQQLTAELDESADNARAVGQLTQERIAAAVAEHRAAHPYRG